MATFELEDNGDRRASAAEDFDRTEKRSDGRSVADSLADGLALLRNLLFERVHDDVQKQFGMDSMLMPVSEEETRAETSLEIELYQVALSVIQAQKHGYVKEAEPWLLHWLTELRLGTGNEDPQLLERISKYLELEKAARRLEFTDALVRALPEARRAPLVLYRLFPLAIKIVTSVAFGDMAAARDERNRQVALLPSIGDCGRCEGRVLDNGDLCQSCGNPVWNYKWLTAS